MANEIDHRPAAAEIMCKECAKVRIIDQARYVNGAQIARRGAARRSGGGSGGDARAGRGGSGAGRGRRLGNL